MTRDSVSVLLAASLLSISVIAESAPVTLNGVKYKSPEDALSQSQLILDQWVSTQSPTSLKLYQLERIGGNAFFVVPSINLVKANYVWIDKGLFSSPSAELVETIALVEQQKFIAAFQAIKRTAFFDSVEIAERDPTDLERSALDFVLFVEPNPGNDADKKSVETRKTDFTILDVRSGTKGTYLFAFGSPHRNIAELMFWIREWTLKESGIGSSKHPSAECASPEQRPSRVSAEMSPGAADACPDNTPR